MLGLAVLLIALVAIAISHGHGGEAELNPIAEAAERTSAMSGSRMDLSMHFSAPGRAGAFTAKGQGEMNWRTQRGQMNMTMSIAGRDVSLETVSDGDSVYTRSSLLSGHLPEGKEWIGVESFLGGQDPNTALSGGADTEELLRSLEATGGPVKDLGRETVRGTETTHYRATVELGLLEDKLRNEGDYAAAQLIEHASLNGQTTFPVEVWVDRNGIVRRIREVVPTGGAEGGDPGQTMEVEAELYDFGIEPDISPPPTSEVFDATSLVKAKLGLDE